MKNARIALLALALAPLAWMAGCSTSATTKHFSPTPTFSFTATPIPTTTESRTASFTLTATFSPTVTVGASIATSNKTGPTGGVVRNAPAHFYINVVVTGAAPATNVTVSDTLDPYLDPATIVFWSGPAGSVAGATITWNLGTINPPSTVTLHFSANVLASAPIGANVCNSAAITSGTAGSANVGPACFSVVPTSPTFTMTSTSTATPTPSCQTPNHTVNNACGWVDHAISPSASVQNYFDSFSGAATVWFSFPCATGFTYYFSLCQFGATYWSNCTDFHIYSSACTNVANWYNCGATYEIAWTATYTGTAYLQAHNGVCGFGTNSCFNMTFWRQ